MFTKTLRTVFFLVFTYLSVIDGIRELGTINLDLDILFHFSFMSNLCSSTL